MIEIIHMKRCGPLSVIEITFINKHHLLFSFVCVFNDNDIINKNKVQYNLILLFLLLLLHCGATISWPFRTKHQSKFELGHRTGTLVKFGILALVNH